jgi:transposase-like protein
MRLVREHRGEYPSEWAAIGSIAAKLGMKQETLRLWLRREEAEQKWQTGRGDGAPAGEAPVDDRQRIRDLEREKRELERENRELRRANEILKAASAFFARELDPRLPTP